MPDRSVESRVHWGSRLSFVLAAAGSAVGLGNIWKFPYITGVNGGGLFVLVYLGCIAVVGLPIFIAELYIGQTAQKNAVEAFEVLDRQRTPWRFPGLLGLVSAFVILSFYSVVAGWILDYEFHFLLNRFAAASDDAIQAELGKLFHSPLRQVFWHLLFMVATVGIVLSGIKDGIERWSRILMPALFGLLLLLLLRVTFEPGFTRALAFLFSFDVEHLTAPGILEAVGHAFFTLSLGMGAMITYGSYLSKEENLLATAFTVGLMDTVIALVAGVVIFSVVFTHGLDAGQGPVLMFQTLPMLFTKMAGGYFVANAFFLLVAFAALTSAVSLLEVVVTYAVETRHKSRFHTTVWCGSIIFLVGIPSALSFNVMEHATVFGMTFFDLVDKLSSRIFLPVGGMVISLFYGWKLGPKAVAATVDKPITHVLTLSLLWAARVVAPLAVLGVLINSVRHW